MLPQRRLLYLDAGQLSAFLWQAGSLSGEGHFAASEQGAAAFSDYLRGHRESNFYLLADVAEEGFQSESLPYSQGADRKAMIGRKLGQFFYGSPLAAAISFGREKGGRRDERFLFTALTRPQQFEPWLAVLRAEEAQLAGVFSLPLLGAQLLGKIPPAHEQCLLVTLTRAGVRQSFFESGQIRFSRLTALATPSAGEAAAACAAEAAKIYQYLLSQRMVARGAPLPLIVLAHPAQMPAFIDKCRSTDELQAQIVDLHALGRACGLKSPPPDSRCETLFLHLLAQSTPREQFAPEDERRFFRLWQARAVLKSVGAVALLGCLLFAGKQFYDLFRLIGATDNARTQAGADAEKYAAIQKTFPPMPVGTDTLRSVINRYEEIDKRSAPLEPLYLAISRGLQDAPAIELERIDWQLGANPDEGASKQDTQKPDAAADRPGAVTHALAIVHGALPAAMAPNQRSQIDAINDFAGALRKEAGLKVTILSRPFDIESGKSLKSGGETAAGAAQPRFVVQISRKL